jgi:hypothetical protein
MARTPCLDHEQHPTCILATLTVLPTPDILTLISQTS